MEDKFFGFVYFPLRPFLLWTLGLLQVVLLCILLIRLGKAGTVLAEITILCVWPIALVLLGAVVNALANPARWLFSAGTLVCAYLLRSEPIWGALLTLAGAGLAMHGMKLDRMLWSLLQRNFIVRSYGDIIKFKELMLIPILIGGLYYFSLPVVVGFVLASRFDGTRIAPVFGFGGVVFTMFIWLPPIAGLLEFAPERYERSKTNGNNA